MRRDASTKSASSSDFASSDVVDMRSAKGVQKPQRKVRKRKIKANRLTVFRNRLGRTQLFVAGSGAMRALSAICKICRVSEVSPSKDGVTFAVPSKLLGKIIALLDNLCYDYKILRVKGFAPAAVGLLARVGLMLGIAAFAVMLAVYPMLVTKVSVTEAGADLPPDSALNAQIVNILASEGVSAGKLLPHVDCEGLGRKLLGLGGIAFASVQRRGTHISVVVKRELEPERIEGKKTVGVVATKLATVTRIVVNGGTAEVAAGDAVQPGDSLIGGYVTYGDSRIEVEPKGTVYGKVYNKLSVFFPDKRQVKRFLAVKTVTKLGFAGKAPKPPEPMFESYELTCSVSQLGFLLPLTAYTYTFRQLEYAAEDETRSDERLLDEVFARILATLDGPVRLLERYDDVKTTADGRWVTVTAVSEEVISRESYEGETF